MTYSVKLDVYEGPLELLLELVSKQRVDPAEVSISTITDEYLKAVAAMGEVDLDVATHFLVLAATLLELKSLKLLPGKLVSDGDLAGLLEERDHLIHRLIEYSTFKQAAGRLKESFSANENFFVRTAPIPQELRGPAPDLLHGLTPDLLARAAGKAFSPQPAPSVDVSHVTPIKVNVADTVAALARRIEVLGTATFSHLCGDAASRIQVVVRFLALLQMFKDESVDLQQDRPFDEIVVRWRRPVRPEPVH